MSDLSITDSNFKAEVLENKGVTVVDFWAAWCGPCRMLGPTIEELATEYKGKVKIVKLNVDENPQTSGQFGIMSLPTIVFFKNGEPVKSMVGVQDKDSYKQEIEQLLSS